MHDAPIGTAPGRGSCMGNDGLEHDDDVSKTENTIMLWRARRPPARWIHDATADVVVGCDGQWVAATNNEAGGPVRSSGRC
jgi:hypothetical protein